MQNHINDIDDLLEKVIQQHNQEIANETLKQSHKNDIKKSGFILYNPDRICKLSKNYDNNKQIKTWMKQAKQAEEMRNLHFNHTNQHTKFVLDYIFGAKK